MLPSQDRPTAAQYDAFAALFGHFNQHLFNGQLPAPMLVFSRRKMVHGHFVFEGWEATDGSKVDEISLNPDRFIDTAPADLASTLVHEMCHQHQHHFGKPSRVGYHNAEFADIMEARGLATTTTGNEGGARTGQRMDHRIIDAGPFLDALDRLGTEVFLPFRCLTSDGKTGPRRPNATKTKYESPAANLAVWGAPGLLLMDAETGHLLATPDESVDELATDHHSAKLELLRLVGGLSDDDCQRVLDLLSKTL